MMNNPLTNRDMVAGLPAHTIRQFLIDANDSLDLECLKDLLRLDHEQADKVLQLLAQDDYLEVLSANGAASGFIKSTRAHHLMAADTGEVLERKFAFALTTQLLREVAEINVSLKSSHRIGRVEFIGEILSNAFGGVDFVEALVEVYPVVIIDRPAGRDMKKSPADDSGKQEPRFASDKMLDTWSRQGIMDKLLDIHPQLCIRFSAQ